HNLSTILGGYSKTIDFSIEALVENDLSKIRHANKRFKFLRDQTDSLKTRSNHLLDIIDENDLDAAHLNMVVVDYLKEITHHVSNIVKPILNHIDNNQKELLPEQLENLQTINKHFKDYVNACLMVFKDMDATEAERVMSEIGAFVKSVRAMRKKQIKRIRDHEVNTRNSILFLGLLGEFRNLVLFTNRLTNVCVDIILHPEQENM
ncbi:MAG: hypothetical protein HKN22_07720, partial [Bacteroidia bacterium]|nr:hypothetical protein [Bacteroidia bacterium]